MEGRLKKLFHRKKGDDSFDEDEHSTSPSPSHRAHGATALPTDSALHGSPYEAAISGGPPMTGTYPIRGTSGPSPVAGFENPTRSPGQHRAGANASFTQSTHQYGASPPTRRPVPSSDNANPASDIYGTGPLPGVAMSTGERVGTRARQNDGDLSQDFSNLNLGIGEGECLPRDTSIAPFADLRLAPRSSTQPQVPSYAPNTYGGSLPSDGVAHRHVRDSSRGESQSSYLPATHRDPLNQVGGVEGAGRTVPGGPRALHHGPPKGNEVAQPYGSTTSPYSAAALYDSAAQQAQEDADLARSKSIPRKQVGAPSTNPSAGTYSMPSSHQSSSSHVRQSSLQKPLPMAPTGARDDYQGSALDQGRQSRPSTDLRPVPLSVIKGSNKLTAEDVVRKSSGKSFDTDVIEKVAPGKEHAFLTHGDPLEAC